MTCMMPHMFCSCTFTLITTLQILQRKMNQWCCLYKEYIDTHNVYTMLCVYMYIDKCYCVIQLTLEQQTVLSSYHLLVWVRICPISVSTALRPSEVLTALYLAGIYTGNKVVVYLMHCLWSCQVTVTWLSVTWAWVWCNVNVYIHSLVNGRRRLTKSECSLHSRLVVFSSVCGLIPVFCSKGLPSSLHKWKLQQ